MAFSVLTAAGAAQLLGVHTGAGVGAGWQVPGLQSCCWSILSAGGRAVDLTYFYEGPSQLLSQSAGFLQSVHSVLLLVHMAAMLASYWSTWGRLASLADVHGAASTQTSAHLFVPGPCQHAGHFLVAC